MKGFGFGDFEGPYAPTGNKRLTTVTIQTTRGRIEARVSVTAGLTNGDDPDAFEFTFVVKGRQNQDITRLAEAIRRGASTISVTVEDLKDSHKRIHSDFATTGASVAVDRLLKHCGR